MDYLELGLVPYAFEPEYSESEIPDLPNLDSEFSDNSNTTSDNEHYSDNDSTDDGSSFSCDVNTSRPELCICGRCPDYSTLPLNERLCCCSTEYLSNKSPINNTCVTQHPDFNVICMHRGVLETAYARNQLDRKRTYNLGASMSNRMYRFTAYRQVIAWGHSWKRIGKGVRKVIPACVVHSIRAQYPRGEEEADYVGFKENSI
ncbi:uncharacterized protein LOC100378225 isoform X1 [Saccoglossus kowalevskii]